MAERPIFFSAPMVKAILDGRKTMTRRVLKPQPIWSDGGSIKDGGGQMDYIEPHWLKEPQPHHAIGDLLWVREAWRTEARFNSFAPSQLDDRDMIYFEADGTADLADGFWGKLRPGMFLPRWASRITLRVTGVKVERLQDISEDDARAEGIFQTEAGSWSAVEGYAPLAGTTAKGGFYCLWSDINGHGSWDANPWVAAISFERIVPAPRDG